MEGGVAVTDDEELYHLMLSLRAHGWTRNLPRFNQVTGEKSDDPFEESYRFVLPGYNLRPLEMSGALGNEQLDKLPGLLRGRRANAAELKARLANHPKFIIQREIGESSWFGFSLVVRPEATMTRTTLLRALTDAGFECRPIVAGNFCRHDVMRYLDYTVHGELRNADYVHANGLFVGNHHYPITDAIAALASI